MATARVVVGDSLAVVRQLPRGSVDLVFTSPPFLALRSYLPDDHPFKELEVGTEPDPATYLDTLLEHTAAWGEVLAPHGSLVVELGDTYAGSGGHGGDYEEGGLRDGQPKFDGAARHRRRSNQELGGPGWPLDKSLVGIPHLFHLSLSYGVNIITGEPSPAGQWRVRNVVAWCRPNPPVGSLGDKFRPATSFLTIATRATDRWFDLDAVRVPGASFDRSSTRNGGQKALARAEAGNPSTGVLSGPTRLLTHPGGAPPNDWWEIPTRPYAGAHYAVFPTALAERPIDSMCPRRVCRACGEPSRRIARDYRIATDGGPRDRDRAGRGRKVPGAPTAAVATTTVGWSTCGCPGTRDLWAGDWLTALGEVETALSAARRRGVSEREKDRIFTTVLPPLYDALGAMYRGREDGHHPGPAWRRGRVLDPFGGSGTTGQVATGRDRDALLIDLDDRNVALATERIGPLLCAEATPAEAADWLTVPALDPTAVTA